MRAKRLLAVFAAFMMSAAVFAAGCGTTGNGGSGGEGPGGPGGEQTQQYTVTFNLNGAPGTAPSSVKVDEGGKVSPPDEPSWTDHKFDGWYTQAEGGEKWDFNSEVTANVTIYAHWTANGGEDKRPDNLPAQTTVYLVGDSTVCSFSDAYYLPRYGYGTQLGNYLTSAVTIKNYAVSGRSSLSFLTDSNGNYDKLKNEISEGDYLIIGFGHNDQKGEDARYTNPNKSYTDETTAGGPSFQKTLYDNYVKLAKDKGATPILCTPIVRLNTSDNYNGSSGHITSTSGNYAGGDYAQAIRNLGEATDTTVIDLTAITKAHYLEIGHAQAMNYHAFTSTSGGVRDDNSIDTTHINKYGAKMVAYNLVTALKNTKNTLKWYVKEDIAAPTYETDYADAINSDYVEPNYKPFDPATDKSSVWGITSEGWYGTAFGDIGGATKATADNFSVVQGTDANSFVIGGKTGSGKIAGGSEGIAAAFRQVPANKNFTITATVKLTGFTNENQNGFGIMLRDTIYVDKYDKAILDNYVAAGVYNNNGTLNALYSRVEKTLTPSGKTLTAEQLAADSEHTLSITKVNQAVTVKFDALEFTYTDFDFVATDNANVYVCLYATRKTIVAFSNVQFEITGDSVAA